MRLAPTAPYVGEKCMSARQARMECVHSNLRPLLIIIKCIQLKDCTQNGMSLKLETTPRGK